MAEPADSVKVELVRERVLSALNMKMSLAMEEAWFWWKEQESMVMAENLVALRAAPFYAVLLVKRDSETCTTEEP